MLFEHITIITIITGIADITVIGTGTIERNFMVKRGRCGIRGCGSRPTTR